jgi:hypothetical protein
MDYENVYYVSAPDYGRNAPLPSRDHRLVASAPPARVLAPATTVGWTSSPTSTPYQYPAPNLYGPTAYPAAYPAGYPAANWTGYPVNPPYITPPVVGPPNNLATILGGFGDIGTLANILAQAVAAFLPLPASPTPQDGTGDGEAPIAAAVNSSNLIRYQNALALYAKRDQQILSLGSILRELFKRPGTVFG